MKTKQPTKAKSPVVPTLPKELKRAYFTLIESTPAAMALLDVMEYRTDQLNAMNAPGDWPTEDLVLAAILAEIGPLLKQLLEQAKASV